MSEATTRKVHTPEFKAKVGLEAVRGVKTINEIGREYGVHPVQVGQWKKAIQENAKTLFEGKRGPKPAAAHRDEDGTGLAEKKVWDQPAAKRHGWIDPGEANAAVQQCALGQAYAEPRSTRSAGRR